MVVRLEKTERPCVYCSRLTKPLRRGEHILAEAIGGALTLGKVSEKVVCERCNNGLLSRLDNELCRRSHLAVIASQELDEQLWQAWDVDHNSDDLLVEARPYWVDGELSRLVYYPQIVFERHGPELRGDADEVQAFGRDDFARVLYKAARGAFQRHVAGEKRSLHLERIQTNLKSRGYRLPPRIFTRHSISEITRKIDCQSFIMRYDSLPDLKFAFRCLSQMDLRLSSSRYSERIGSRLPTLSTHFDIGLTVRALLKLGVNLIAAYCPKTPVTGESFGKVIRMINGEDHPSESLIANNGFVRADDVRCISAPDRSHSFRLSYVDGHWTVMSSFFGGRLGAVVSFPGANHEDWGTMNIVAPLRSKDWRIDTSSILFPPPRYKVEWRDLSLIAPSVKMQRASSALVVERAVPRSDRVQSTS
jgi:HNH endonuclease